MIFQNIIFATFIALFHLISLTKVSANKCNFTPRSSTQSSASSESIAPASIVEAQDAVTTEYQQIPHPTNSGELVEVLDSPHGNLISADTSGSLSGSFSGIGSWYQADINRDDTNGRGWCEFDYTDDFPSIAPSLSLMTSGFSDVKDAKRKYCGLEVNVTVQETGKSMLLYILDAFDYPRTSGSVDIMFNPFKELTDYSGYDKNFVKDVDWYLTGNRAEKWTYNR